MCVCTCPNFVYTYFVPGETIKKNWEAQWQISMFALQNDFFSSFSQKQPRYSFAYIKHTFQHNLLLFIITNFHLNNSWFYLKVSCLFPMEEYLLSQRIYSLSFFVL